METRRGDSGGGLKKRRFASVLFAALSFTALPARVSAQASAYVPLDDIAYTYVNALMARGIFRELSSLERPYTERALRVAIDSARTREPGPVIASYLDALYLAVEKYAVRRPFARAGPSMCMQPRKRRDDVS